MIKQKTFFLFHAFFGIVFSLLGVLSLLGQFGYVYFIPLRVFTLSFLEVMIMLVGLFFIREAVRNKNSEQRFVHFVVGLGLFFFAIFPLFVTLGVLKFLPYYIDLEMNVYVLSFLLLGAGLYMIFDRVFLVFSS
ncbi:MAG: hypothetical protein QT08_C0009G0071 [archaeon GW2011_AR17]|nr:MAG: hypothetical protein QT08_C0009G0071 [archaeon GW2011_AR17]MBS3154137.1 hypothetical protein [Candidatus Woesearchaeota archaeon]HIH14732.1 hypothetical protein [Nanoarchaeota archaeon]HIH59023.1 hypothetical protein [Nanoarchaeota archaeon]HII14411.1 hypothetical protein [Nanoarchaeota archaeon]